MATTYRVEGATVYIDGVDIFAPVWPEWDAEAATAHILADCDETTFDVGDIVMLVSGGPHMTVISIAECGCVEVAWADSQDDVCIDVFPVEALVEAE